MARDKAVRAAVINVVRDGELTMGEAARLAGVARVTVLYWCRAAGIDAAAVRAPRVRTRWEAAINRSAEPMKRLTLDVCALEAS